MRKVYHRNDFLNSPEMEKLQDIVENWHEDDSGKRDFASFEKRVHRALADLECTIIGKALEDLDVDCDEIEFKGAIYGKAYRLPQTYYGLSGELIVERNLYSPINKDGHSICPLDYRAGIIEGAWTPSAAELMAFLVAETTPYGAEMIFKKFGGITPSRSSLDRLPRALSKRWEASREEWEQILRSRETVLRETASLAISLDGVKVPMKDGHRSAKREQSIAQGKKPQGPAGYKEASCGTASLFDEDGKRLHTVYYGRMPESMKFTLHSQLEKEARSILAANSELNVVLLADGARDNWRILGNITEKLIEEGILKDRSNVYEINDFYHSCEHLKVVTDLYYGENSIKSRACFEELRIKLKDEEEGIGSVIRKITYFRNRSKGKKRKSLSRELKYFRNRKNSMRYAKFQRLNIPIGSGVVEAACKTLVTQRLKRSGMRWENEGGQGVLTLRSLVQSKRWDAGWDLLSGSYKAPILTVKGKKHLALIQNIKEAA